MAKAEKSWEKRLSGEPDELMVDFVESLSVDKRLYVCPGLKSQNYFKNFRQLLALPKWAG